MSSLASLLPQAPGILPKWLLFISLVSVGNTIQAFLTTTATSQVYSNNPSKNVTGLQSRTFGTWTFLSCVIRMYAAYHISNPQIYEIAFWSYLVAFAHFGSEWFVFRTANFGKGLIGPLIVSTSTIVWMIQQRSFYIGN